MNDELKDWADEAQKMIDYTNRVEECMKGLKKNLHAAISERIFEVFPFLPDKMGAHEIRFMGERISRQIYLLSEELKNFAFTVQQRTENSKG